MEFVKKNTEFIHSRDIEKLSEFESREFWKSYSYINYLSYLCKIDGEFYHKKRIYKEDVVNELLGRIISEYLGDIKINTKIIRDECNRFSILTENFINKNKTYINLNNNIFHKLIFDNFRLDIFSIDLFDEIKVNDKVYKVNEIDLDRLKYKLKMMIISDFIRKHCDRDFKNFMFEYNKGHCKLMPLYDFELSFLEYDDFFKNTFKFNLDNSKLRDYVKNDLQFQELLNLVMNMDINKIFEVLFDLYPVRMKKEEIIKYKNIVEEKKSEIKKYKLVI